MKLPIGTPCVIVKTGKHSAHLIGHYCEVIEHLFNDFVEYKVHVKSQGDTNPWKAARENLMPIKPDEDLDKVDEENEDEVTA
jgi:hypothetical protein